MTDLSQYKIAVAGAGAMGSGIAQVAASAGHEVLLYDLNPEMPEKAIRTIAAGLAKLEEKGKIAKGKGLEIVSRIKATPEPGSLRGSDLFIEAIVENSEAKANLFSAIGRIIPGAILATNTSSLSVTQIAAACPDPSNAIGLHFFNPATLMPLVEVIPAAQTREQLPFAMTELMRAWGKTPVLAKDSPGFIVNRVARPFYGEALRIYEEGIAGIADIDWAMKEIGGFRMGPFELMDFIGNDVNYAVTESVFRSFYFDPRYKPSLIQLRQVLAGWLGRKSGRGYYDYTEGAINPQSANNAEQGAVIVQRILAMLINEAADALYLGIASKEDLDLAMTRGVNYPKGLLAWADEQGVSHWVCVLDELFDEYREDRYRCSPLLRRMHRMGESFYSQ